MGAGDKTAFEQVRPVLDDLGENVFHLGDLGTGHTIKLLNNFYSMVTANAMSEAFAACDLAGVPRKQFYDVISAGPNHSGMMDFVKAYALDGDPDQLAFAVKNGLKDVGYYSQMMQAAGASSILAGGVATALERATQDGHGDDTVPQMVDSYRRWFTE